MNLVVFGATGGTGRAVVARAAALSHQVRAFVRAPEGRSGLPGDVEIVRGDARDRQAVLRAVTGMDAVVSSLGQGSSNQPTTHMSDGIAIILAAMGEAGVSRLLCVSSLGACDDPHEPFLFRTVGRWLFGNIFADHRRMEANVRASDRAWTIVRPASLTDGPETGRYRTAIDNRAKGANKISRADAAHFLLEELANGAHQRQAVALGY